MTRSILALLGGTLFLPLVITYLIAALVGMISITRSRREDSERPH